ncbi:DUF58 domain-containing protein [Paenibacillus arenilitoris]|uniref:DUF58 domain-containing protein n=1 Tax=Paenibacillus arenilitoris TaxID=2772299 RepID=A0A927H745_9BACL|nr:DUF58 domain-containing protein [Paenibacillus arenilitoris]MBD2871216.1 DUF58 domain-containing protein [Paenibacillus arenilitoris]
MNTHATEDRMRQEGFGGEAAFRHAGAPEPERRQPEEAVRKDVIAEPLKREPEGGEYRTRWLAWTIIAAGWAGSLAAIVLRGGAAEWFLAAVLGLVIIVSGLAPIMAAAGLRAERTVMKQEVREGGRQAVRLTVGRSYFVPFVWFAVRDAAVNETSPSSRAIGYQTVVAPLGRKEISVHYFLHKLRRGRHPYGPVSVTVGDWLGLTAVHKKIEAASEFIVLPGLPAEERLDDAGQAGIAAAGEARRTLAGAPIDPRGEMGREEVYAAVRAAGIGPDSRPYREGDSLRHLDWRSAAKGRGLQTKLFPQERPVQTYIAIDTAAAGYDKDDLLFDACVGWAALAVRQAVASGNAVTLLTGQGAATAGSDVKDWSRQNGEAELLREMALLRADGQRSLAGSLASGEKALARGGAVLVFTADWQGGRSWGELAGYAAEQGCRMELFIVTRHHAPTFAMREQQQWLARGGVKVTWLNVPDAMGELPYASGEGGEAHVDV